MINEKKPYLSDKRIMKEFPDATILFYAWGSFDKWCVFEGNAHNLNRAKPLKDIEYFKQIKWLAEKYSPDHVWENFKYLYNAMADDMPEEYVCDRISDLAKNFPMNSLFADKLYTKLYLTMLAEERKENSMLGRSIKALGIHQVVKENMSPYVAANFSFNLPWRTIEGYCKERNIFRQEIPLNCRI